jgi:preprotein translocase subunit SecA
MSEGLLRPGPALGFYPERRDAGPGRLDRIASRVAGFVAQQKRLRGSHLDRFVARVGGQEASLRREPDKEIEQRARELRAELMQRGLREDLVARSFALVREVARRTLGMRHFDTQLIGGWVMVNGMLAEMETGEGKTLVATLPACTAALAGIPVHVITVNDYLVTRDAELMGPVYRALGLRVGTVTEGVADPDSRRAAYACDVTYCTNKQLAFDYLRDRVVLGHTRGQLPLQLERLHQKNPRIDRLLLRGLCFAIVDEADSVLIDEARTPLILSRTAEAGDEQEVYAQAVSLASRLEPGRDFSVDEREREVTLTPRGKERAAELARPFEGIWTGPRRREALVRQALSAHHLFVRDKHYLVKDGKVLIIDPNTGRVMPDRSWERGLHQMIEAKEGCEITGQRETLARITYQRFFRRYLRLSGMTGTAREVAGELRSVYGLETVAVPTHRPVQRRGVPDRIHASSEAKWADVVASIRALHEQGRPVLVGTCSVAASEHLSRLLRRVRLPHQLLNARQDRAEARIIARAGEAGRITVATNMAGRGTDIRLAPGVVELGGLHVIATERNEARRIDRQLFGRCGRQGDPGSFQAILSLEDDLVRLRCPQLLRRLAERVGSSGGWLAAGPRRALLALAQRAAEGQHARARRELLKMDEELGKMLAFTGPLE